MPDSRTDKTDLLKKFKIPEGIKRSREMCVKKRENKKNTAMIITMLVVLLCRCRVFRTPATANVK